MKLELNIGLFVNGKLGNIGPATVMRDVMASINPSEIHSRLAYARGTCEPTMVMEMTCADNIDLDGTITGLCLLLRQDCIAGKTDGSGFLIGPNTAPYGGEFNPEYFITF